MNNEPTLFDKTPLIHKADHFTEEQKVKSRKNAESQEARILGYFEIEPDFSFPATWLWTALHGENEPLTSFRRALSNLAKQGKIEKLRLTTIGMYGKPEHYWRMKRDE